MKISVQSVHFHADTKLLDYVEKKVRSLERFFERAVEAEVYLKLQDTGSKVQEKVTEIRLRVPGNSLIDKKSGKTFESAIVSSVEALKRQLVRVKQKNGEKRLPERPAALATGKAPLEHEEGEA